MVSKREKKAAAFKAKMKGKSLETDTVVKSTIEKENQENQVNQPNGDKIIEENVTTSEKIMTENKTNETKKTSEKKNNPQKRYIVFVGNLPSDATEKGLKEHLKVSNPTSVRLRKPKNNSTKCFAFVEFQGDNALKRMDTCLQLHHTYYLDSKINVELTVGGGGSKSSARKEKLRQKNSELRSRRIKKMISSRKTVKST